MSDKIKVLICGDVEGRFKTLFKKIATINSKSGPFDLLLCTGNFFGINNKEFEPYRSGKEKVSIPTYILGPNSADQREAYGDLMSVDLAENVHYLGKRGLYVSSSGLKIAYLSGVSVMQNADSKLPDVHKDHEFSTDDVSALRDICLRGNASYRGVDILLTAQWPLDITRNDKSWIDSTILNSASPHCAWIASQIRPRYHISGLEGLHYERPPFRIPNADLEIPTRFMALGRVANSEKKKWLYALSLTPLDKMKLTDLLQRTTDETACPFDVAELEAKLFNKRKVDNSQKQYFYDMSAPGEKSRGKKGQGGKRPRMEFDQSKCWFCLASPSVEKHLIVTVGTNVYIALAKGGMVDEHLLICPVEHYQCSIGQPDDVRDEVERYKQALTSFFDRRDQVPVFFERNFKTSHMQIQAVPIPKNAVKEIVDIFKEESEGNGVELQELESHSRLDQVLQANVPYFVVDLPNNKTLYSKIQGKQGFPLNFGREVLAVGAILDMAERVDWKECMLGKEDEIKLVERIRTDFEPFDINDD